LIKYLIDSKGIFTSTHALVQFLQLSFVRGKANIIARCLSCFLVQQPVGTVVHGQGRCRQIVALPVNGLMNVMKLDAVSVTGTAQAIQAGVA
jgi:hypothetical protein